MQTGNTAILSIEPTMRTTPSQKRALRAARSIANQLNLTIEPVCLIPRDLSADAHVSRLKRLAPDAQVIFVKKGSTSTQVELLHEHALARQARLIIATTHGHSGWARLSHGSFTEALILHSTIPILSFSPKSPTERKIARILFATNLSEGSRRVLRELLPFARDLNAKITMFHTMPLPNTRNITLDITSFEDIRGDLPAAWKEELEKRSEVLDSFVETARAHGVAADCFHDASGMSAHRAVLEFAQSRDFDLIALAGESGPKETFFTGLTARKIVRNAPCAVWILHENPSGRLAAAAA